MADSPFRPPDNGKIGMPPVDGAMNKLPPSASGGGRGAKSDKDDTRLGLDEPEEQSLLLRAKKRMDKAIEAEGDNRKAAIDDLKFYKGDQWPADIAAQRNFDQRPCLTINKLPTFVNQVTNDVRQNRPAINVSPVGDRGDPEVAKMYAGMIREIERKSVADIAYDTAFASAARCGIGYWRILTEYESPKSLNQVITIKRVRNAFTIYLDPAHQEPDGSDASWAFISENIPRDDFKEDYPDAQQMPWVQGGAGDNMKSWNTKDEIRVVEYYEFEDETRTVVRLSNGSTGWKDEIDKTILDRFEIEEERESVCRKLMWHKMTAVEVLESAPCPGKWIPIVKVIGDEVDVDGKVQLSGIVRHAKDAQRMYNYWVTSETEMVALAPKAPWVIAEGQDEGYEGEWKNSNVRSNPTLHYRMVGLEGHPAPPPSRNQAVQVPAGIVQAKQGAAQDMMATTGIRFDATLGERMYDESGRALRELRERGDLGSFHLVDNLARSLRQTGVIIVDWIPYIYNERRVETILREGDMEERVVIDPTAPKPMGEQRDPQTNKTMKIFNPTYGEYGVTVTIGPSYATKRIEAAESMMDFLRAVGPVAPQLVSGVADLIAKNQDWPEAQEFATRIAKLVAQMHPGIMSPDIKDVTPEVQALMMGMQAQLQQSQQQIQALTKALTDVEADRAQRDRKMELDFEAKILGVMQKADASVNAHIGAQLKELAQAVHVLHDNLMAPSRPVQ